MFGLGKTYDQPTYDMSGYSSLGFGGTGQEGFGVPTQAGDYDVLGNKIDEITGEIDRIPYEVKKDSNGNIKLVSPIVTKEFSPEEISAQVLRKLADDAGKYNLFPVRRSSPISWGEIEKS